MSTILEKNDDTLKNETFESPNNNKKDDTPIHSNSGSFSDTLNTNDSEKQTPDSSNNHVLNKIQDPETSKNDTQKCHHNENERDFSQNQNDQNSEKIISELKKEIVSLKFAKSEIEDKYKRSLADIENIRKTSQTDVMNARKYCVEAFAKEVIKIHDNLTQAYDICKSHEEENKRNNISKTEEDTHTPPNQDKKNTLVDGIRLVIKDIEKIFHQYDIQRMEVDFFDPHYHQAVQMLESDEENGKILQVLSNGYTIEKRPLKHALVVVSKKK